MSLSLLVTACAAPCELEAGTYDTFAYETSGDCGPQDSGVVIIGPGEIPTPDMDDCTGPVTFTDDGCGVNFDVFCTTGGVSAEVEGFTEIVSPTAADGALSITVPGTCRSTYNISYRLR